MSRTIKSMEFVDFFEDMFQEYERHLPKQGESWKTCDIEWLEHLLLKSMSYMTHEYLQFNPSHVIDIANFCAFWYLRYKNNSPEESIKDDKNG